MSTECPCGISREECEYHRPDPIAPEPRNAYNVSFQRAALTGDITSSPVSNTTPAGSPDPVAPEPRTPLDDLLRELPYPQCVSKPLTAAWARKSFAVPASCYSFVLLVGDIMRREDGEWRMVVATSRRSGDYGHGRYATEPTAVQIATRYGQAPYVLAPPGWEEVPLDKILGG